MADYDSLTSKQLQFAGALALGRSVAEAGVDCHVSERTAYRWARIPEITSARNDIAYQLHQRAVARLLSKLDRAVDVLDKLLNAKSEYVRLQAASKILEVVTEHIAIARCEEGLQELHARLDAHEQQAR